MNIRKGIFFLLIWTCFENHLLKAQPISVEIWSGLAIYQGDIRTDAKPSIKAPIASGIGFNYPLNDFISISSLFKMGKLQGDDKSSSDPLRRIRNLNFKTKILEWSFMARGTLFPADTRKFNPFVEAGIAIFHFNPYTYDISGNKQYLNPLGTEGQGLSAYPNRKPYSLIQLSIPIGGGIQFKINDLLNFYWNFGWRKTFTDYIDDISKTYADPNMLLLTSQKSLELAFRSNELNPTLTYPTSSMPRGNSKNMDGYFFTGFGMIFKTQKSFGLLGEKKMNAHQRCPKF